LQRKFAEKIKTQIFVVQKVSKNRTVYEITCRNVLRAGHAIYDNMGHVQCMLGTSGYEHAVRICTLNNYCFSTATIVTRTRPYVTVYHIVCFVYINDWPSGHKNCPCSQQKLNIPWQWI